MLKNTRVTKEMAPLKANSDFQLYSMSSVNYLNTHGNKIQRKMLHGGGYKILFLQSIAITARLTK